MKSSGALRKTLLETSPWRDLQSDVWLASVVSLSRSLDNFAFPHKLDVLTKNQVVGLVQNALEKKGALENPTALSSEKAEALDKTIIYERYLTREGLLRLHSGESFILDGRGRLLVLVNVDDHMQFVRCQAREERLEDALREVGEVERKIAGDLSYAYSSQFGFLTADPGMCGTGLEVRIFLQLPVLIHLDLLQKVLQEHGNESVEVEGISGSPELFVGDVVVAKNRHKLGLTEDAIAGLVHTLSTQLMVEEQGKRTNLDKEEDTLLKDKVSRAYGLLMHSFQIRTAEALESLSMMKLGVQMGWVQGVDLAAVNRILFFCRRGHLSVQEGRALTIEEAPEVRARYIHEHLKKASLQV